MHNVLGEKIKRKSDAENEADKANDKTQKRAAGMEEAGRAAEGLGLRCV